MQHPTRPQVASYGTTSATLPGFSTRANFAPIPQSSSATAFPDQPRLSWRIRPFMENPSSAGPSRRQSRCPSRPPVTPRGGWQHSAYPHFRGWLENGWTAPRLSEWASRECRGMAWWLRPTQNRGTAVVQDHAGELDLRHLVTLASARTNDEIVLFSSVKGRSAIPTTHSGSPLARTSSADPRRLWILGHCVYRRLGEHGYSPAWRNHTGPRSHLFGRGSDPEYLGRDRGCCARFHTRRQCRLLDREALRLPPPGPIRVACRHDHCPHQGWPIPLS